MYTILIFMLSTAVLTIIQTEAVLERIVTVTEKPSPPRNLRVVDVYKDFITVAWDAPETDGGAPLTGFTVEKADAKRKTFTNAGSTDAATLKFKVGKLSEGNEYLIRVFAENAIGQSDPVTLSDPVTAKLPFGESTAELCYL